MSKAKYYNFGDLTEEIQNEVRDASNAASEAMNAIGKLRASGRRVNHQALLNAVTAIEITRDEIIARALSPLYQVHAVVEESSETPSQDQLINAIKGAHDSLYDNNVANAKATLHDILSLVGKKVEE